MVNTYSSSAITRTGDAGAGHQNETAARRRWLWRYIAALCRGAATWELRPEFFRVVAFGDEFADAFDDHGTVFAVGDAEPGIGRAEDLAFGLAGGDEVAHSGGDVALGFLLGAGALEEFLELDAELREQG